MAEVSVAHARQVVGDATDRELRLFVDAICEPDGSQWAVPAYRFDLDLGGYRVGTVRLRVGSNERLIRFAGQVGFSVEPEYGGRRLAGRAVRLLLPLAASHDLSPLWLTCSPDNATSIQVTAWLEASYIETVDLPPDYDGYIFRGERQKCRFRLDY